ncbi:DeoR family transcriptional regulator [Actinomycetes bacterium KLBMP 9797]
MGDTIRRDLDNLAERRVLARTHGGAMRTDALATADTPFDSRASTHHRAKEAIGRPRGSPPAASP